MKNTLQAMLLLAIVLGWQACGSKSESSADEDSNSAETATATADETATSEQPAASAEDVPNPEASAATATPAPAAGESSNTYTSKSGKTVYNRAEVQPSYKGGNEAMVTYLKDNLSYPDGATGEGTVNVAFVVGDDGSVQDVEVLSGANDPVLRSEAVRVVSTMPKWSPGMQGNKPVNAKFMVPITFKK